MQPVRRKPARGGRGAGAGRSPEARPAPPRGGGSPVAPGSARRLTDAGLQPGSRSAAGAGPGERSQGARLGTRGSGRMRQQGGPAPELPGGRSQLGVRSCHPIEAGAPAPGGVPDHLPPISFTQPRFGSPATWIQGQPFAETPSEFANVL